MATSLLINRAAASVMQAVSRAAAGPSSFAGLPLPPPLLARVQATGIVKPLPIQEAALRRVFAGESVALHSQTGSGKTLAYMLPLLARLRRNPDLIGYVPKQVLICVPTRELALQSVEVANQLLPASARR